MMALHRNCGIPSPVHKGFGVSQSPLGWVSTTAVGSLHSLFRRKDGLGENKSMVLRIAVLLLGAADESFKVIVAQTSV